MNKLVPYPVIDVPKTGARIKFLIAQSGLTVKEPGKGSGRFRVDFLLAA